jgi:hypothetical protein
MSFAHLQTKPRSQLVEDFDRLVVEADEYSAYGRGGQFSNSVAMTNSLVAIQLKTFRQQQQLIDKLDRLLSLLGKPDGQAKR